MVTTSLAIDLAAGQPLPINAIIESGRAEENPYPPSVPERARQQ